jgi:hypothetical protein
MRERAADLTAADQSNLFACHFGSFIEEVV